VKPTLAFGLVTTNQSWLTDELAGTLRDTARSWGRSRVVTDWDAGGILYGDADGIAEQALCFAEIGVTELGVAIHHVDELRWFSERVIARLGSATT
jgi:hypothetical protein